jgi:hypothetical protein
VHHSTRRNFQKAGLATAVAGVGGFPLKASAQPQPPRVPALMCCRISRLPAVTLQGCPQESVRRSGVGRSVLGWEDG